MTLTKLFPFACAALMMGACTSEDSDNKGGDAAGKAQYLAVNIVSVGSNGTRAANDNFENGTENESKINDVRFYFFNADGSPYILANTQGVNWTTPAENFNGDKNDDGNNVTQVSKAILVFKSESGEAAPYSVIAVVNANSLANSIPNALGNSSKTLSQLLEQTVDNQFYLSDATGTLPTNYEKAAKAKNFVMTNSVYEEAGQRRCQAFISGHVSATEELAKNNPVDIYVERAVAKVTASLDENAGWVKGDGTNWDTDKYGKVVGKTTSGTDVYAVLEGWNIADENGMAELEKQIQTGWTSNGLGFPTNEVWSSSDYHRSFWSESTPVGTANNPTINYSYNQIAGNGFGSCVYTLPNTSQTAVANKYSNSLTKFIVATTLRYEDNDGNWHNAEICEYKGIQYIGQDAVLDVIGSESGVYEKTNDGSNDVYTLIGHKQMKFVADSKQQSKDYKAMATVDSGKYGDTSDVFYTKDGSGNFQSISVSAVNALIQRESADIRNGGKAYYYTTIRHLGIDENKPAYYGIVRNHVYKINLQDMKGFGTPVIDAEKVITPTVPDNEATYLAARINVLSWRIVNQNANLDYSK